MEESVTGTPITIKRGRNQESPDELQNFNIKRRQYNKIMKVGDMTLGSLMEAMSELLAQKMCDLVTKEDLKCISEELDMIKSQQHAMKEQVAQLVNENNKLKNDIENMQRFVRRNNLIFKGLSQPTDTTTPKTSKQLAVEVATFCKEILKVDCDNINNAFQIASTKDIVVEFASTREVSDVLQNVRKLKGTKISVYKDLTPQARERRKLLLKLKSRIEIACPRKKVNVSGDILIVENCKFTCSLDGKVYCKGRDGIDQLSKILNCDCNLMVKEIYQSNAFSGTSLA